MSQRNHLADLETLTSSLPAQAAALARRVDQLATLAAQPRADGEVVCPWCLESPPYCPGGHPEEAAAYAEAMAAPIIRIRVAGGDRR